MENRFEDYMSGLCVMTVLSYDIYDVIILMCPRLL